MHLVFVLAAFALLVGFFALTRYEAQGGARLLARSRERLDKGAARTALILAHVDFAAFAREETRRFAHFIGHKVVHVSLRVVRAIERLLTRLVRRIRAAHGTAVASRESARPFVQSLSDFKDRLKASRPEASDTHI